MQSNLILVLFVLFTLLSLAYASGSSSSSSIIGGVLLTAFGFSIFSRLIQRIAPNFVFSLLPYHSVSC